MIERLAQEYAWKALGDMGLPQEDYQPLIAAFLAGARAIEEATPEKSFRVEEIYRLSMKINELEKAILALKENGSKCS